MATARVTNAILHLPAATHTAGIDWTRPAPKYTRGVLHKFARLGSAASKGAMTDRD